MLRLAKGDILIVDMSEPRVKNGTTDPTLIEQYINKGVAAYSSSNLHAKVFVFDDVAVVGSTNVSKYSDECSQKPPSLPQTRMSSVRPANLSLALLTTLTLLIAPTWPNAKSSIENLFGCRALACQAAKPPMTGPTP